MQRRSAAANLGGKWDPSGVPPWWHLAEATYSCVIMPQIVLVGQIAPCDGMQHPSRFAPLHHQLDLRGDNQLCAALHGMHTKA